MSKYTPWKVVEGNAFVVADSVGNRVATCRYRSTARFIAAAPDLLEALKGMVVQFKCACVPIQRCARCFAVDALAKAEGQSNE